ncbi:MAG: hypothetical protein ACD_84C00022G0002 [uncultured bacterium]|nr:MAG: hypothetical protein ACD_84C00022G0002 [uncultured bacterium]
MTISKTAFETTACVGFPVNKITSAVEAAFHEGNVALIENTHVYSIAGGTALVNNVPAFAHPVSIKINDENKMFIDVRSFGIWDINTNAFKVRNEIDYALMVVRGKLNYIWCNENPRWLQNVSPAPMAAYAQWISEAVSRRFALDPREQLSLAILAAIFYNSQFSDDAEINEHEKLRITTIVTRAVHASAQDVLAILDKVSVINNVYEFCAKAEEITGSVRLKELNPGVLFSILGGTWFGTNAKEMIAVAVEHPPTWLAILLSAFTERTFRNSQISKLVERSTFKKIGEDYVRAVLNMLRVTAKE